MLVLFIRTVYHWLFFFFSFSILCHQGLAIELAVEAQVWDFFYCRAVFITAISCKLDTPARFSITLRKLCVVGAEQLPNRLDCCFFLFLFPNIYVGKDSRSPWKNAGKHGVEWVDERACRGSAHRYARHSTVTRSNSKKISSWRPTITALYFILISPSANGNYFLLPFFPDVSYWVVELSEQLFKTTALDSDCKLQYIAQDYTFLGICFSNVSKAKAENPSNF